MVEATELLDCHAVAWNSMITKVFSVQSSNKWRSLFTNIHSSFGFGAALVESICWQPAYKAKQILLEATESQSSLYSAHICMYIPKFTYIHTIYTWSNFSVIRMKKIYLNVIVLLCSASVVVTTDEVRCFCKRWKSLFPDDWSKCSCRVYVQASLGKKIVFMIVVLRPL